MHCQQGAPEYSFCRLPRQQILNVVCPPLRSAYASFAKPQQVAPLDQTVIDHLKKFNQLCSLAKQSASGNTQMISILLSQLCSEAPPTDKIVAVLPNLRQMIEETSNFCNIYPTFTSPEEVLSTVRSRCTAWDENRGSICGTLPNLCRAVFSGMP